MFNVFFFVQLDISVCYYIRGHVTSDESCLMLYPLYIVIDLTDMAYTAVYTLDFSCYLGILDTIDSTSI